MFAQQYTELVIVNPGALAVLLGEGQQTTTMKVITGTKRRTCASLEFVAVTSGSVLCLVVSRLALMLADYLFTINSARINKHSVHSDYPLTCANCVLECAWTTQEVRHCR